MNSNTETKARSTFSIPPHKAKTDEDTASKISLDEAVANVELVFFGIDEEMADPLGDRRFEYDGFNPRC